MSEKIGFFKMQGLGNDFIMVMGELPDASRLAVKWCNRRTGIGADCLILVLPPQQGGDVSMRIFNADGSEAGMCGNASRCIGKLLYEEGLTDKTSLLLETLSGMKRLQLQVVDGQVESVTVAMGEALLLPVLRPNGSYSTFVNEEIVADGRTFVGTAIDVGNPHLVLSVDDVERLDVARYGPILENSALFPQRVNVEFAQILDGGRVRLRVWERGAGITSACGTGACATVAAAMMNAQVKGLNVKVIMDGGELLVSCDSISRQVEMSGPASLVYSGEIFV